MLRRLAAWLCLSLALASAALAQDQPSAPSADAPAQTAPASDPAPADHQTRALIEALKDDTTRARLVEALEQGLATTPAPTVAEQGARQSTGRVRPPIVGAPGGAATDTNSDAAEAEAGADASAPPPSIGDWLLGAAPLVATELIADFREDLHEIRTTFARLGGLSQIRPAEARSVTINLAILAAVAYGAWIAAQLAFLPLVRRMGATAQTVSLSRKVGLSGLAVLVELIALAIAATALLFTISAINPDEDPPDYPSYFFVAFLFSGLFAVAARAVFSPATPYLRPIPLDDQVARYWCRHLVILLGLITYGEILVGEVVRHLTGPITANAFTTLFHVVGVVYLASLILIHRRGPPSALAEKASKTPDNVALVILARLTHYWHYPALFFLLLLLHKAFTTGQSALPQLVQAAWLVLSLAVAAYVIGLLNRMADRGVQLSSELNHAMPNLGSRLNAFVPAFLRFLRYVVFLFWAGFALQSIGLARPGDWLEVRYGVDFASAATSLVVIVLIGYLAWLVVTSWIDYRLAPVNGVHPSARQQTLYSLLRNAALVGILLIGLTYALSSIGISVAPLLASAGVVGLAIGFGSQKLVQDIINGLFIQFENAINVGDVVELAGRIGTVEKLTIRSVSLRDVQGVLHIIPFSSVDSVSNHMKGYSYHVADIGVAYGADLDAAKDEMLAAYDDLADDYEWGAKLLGGVEWFGVETLGDSSVILRARLKTRPGEQWGVGRAYAERVKRRFDARGIEIPFPQMKLWLDPGEKRPLRPAPPLAPRQSLAEGGPTDASGEGADSPGEAR